jgi:hypothetical protein
MEGLKIQGTQARIEELHRANAELARRLKPASRVPPSCGGASTIVPKPEFKGEPHFPNAGRDKILCRLPQSGDRTRLIDTRDEGPALRKKLKRAVGLTVSLLVHSACLVAILFCFASRQPPPLPETIPISVVINETVNLGRQLHSELGSSGSNTPLDAGLASQASVSQTSHRRASNSSGISVDHKVRAELNSSFSSQFIWSAGEREPSSAKGATRLVEKADRQPPEVEEADRDPESGEPDDVDDADDEKADDEKADGKPRELTIARRTDWDASPIEDDKLTYSAPGSPVKFTMREVSSFTGFGMNDHQNSGAFALAPMLWGDDATARSKRVDWSVVNSRDFGVTAFSYQSAIGRTFQPADQTKNEFAMPGTSTTTAGGKVRAGAFDFGFAVSSVEYAGPGTELLQQGVANATAVQQEALVSLDLRRLLSGSPASSEFFSTLLPTLWVTVSDKHNGATGLEAVPKDAITSSFGAPTIWVTGQTLPQDTTTSSFGGKWKSDIGYASLSYWRYSSSGGEGIAPWAGSGHGFNASAGAEYSSFEIEADFTYGQFENIASSQQSGRLYDSNVTVSYKPDGLPGLWAKASAGNYNQNAITGTWSDFYDMPTSSRYWSITAGLDLTNLFWETKAFPGQHSAVKLLYKYSYSLDSSLDATRTVDNLVAMMVRRSF